MHIGIRYWRRKMFPWKKIVNIFVIWQKQAVFNKAWNDGIRGHEENLLFCSWLRKKSGWKNPLHVWADAERWRCRHAIGFRHCLDKDFSQSQDWVPFRKLPLLCCCPSLWLSSPFPPPPPQPLQEIVDWGIVLMICSVFQRGWLIWKTQQDSWNCCQKLSSVLLSQLPAFCAFAAETGPLRKMQLDVSWYSSNRVNDKGVIMGLWVFPLLCRFQVVVVYLPR